MRLPIRCPGKCDGGVVEQGELYNMLPQDWWIRYLMLERFQVGVGVGGLGVDCRLRCEKRQDTAPATASCAGQ